LVQTPTPLLRSSAREDMDFTMTVTAYGRFQHEFTFTRRPRQLYFKGVHIHSNPSTLSFFNWEDMVFIVTGTAYGRFYHDFAFSDRRTSTLFRFRCVHHTLKLLHLSVLQAGRNRLSCTVYPGVKYSASGSDVQTS
ncbi:hypothetical protein BaRGS_00025443, partial [Batillaria attramentaria]